MRWRLNYVRAAVHTTSAERTTLGEVGIPMMCGSRTFPSQPKAYFQSSTGAPETTVATERTKAVKDCAKRMLWTLRFERLGRCLGQSECLHFIPFQVLSKLVRVSRCGTHYGDPTLFTPGKFLEPAFVSRSGHVIIPTYPWLKAVENYT